MPKVILSLFDLFVIFHTLTPGAFKLPTLILQLLINTYDRIISNLAYRINSIKYELWSIFYYIQSYNLYSVVFIASLLFYILCRNNIYDCVCHIFENHISNMNRCRNLNSFQCFHTVKDFSFRNVFFCLYRYHVNAAAIIGLSSTAS